MGSSHRDFRSSRNTFRRWSVAGALSAAALVVPQVASAQTLLESSRFAAGLITPLDSRTETTRAVNSAGRADPFVPLNVSTPPEPLPEETLVRGTVTRPQPPSIQRPGIPPSTGSGSPSQPVAVGTEGAEPVEPEVFVDPAEFSRGVQVSGVITVGGESFALLSAQNTARDVVRTGDFYETAQVANVSQFGRSVTLEEGGESVTASVPQ